MCGSPSAWRVGDDGAPSASQPVRLLGALGEGEAMLAAAGSPDVNPHMVDDDSIQRRWERDVAHAPASVAELSSFFADVPDERITTGDSVRGRANSYFGVQGPWYTVGWLMASTVERELGRPALIAELCVPTRLLADYNRACSTITRFCAKQPLPAAHSGDFQQKLYPKRLLRTIRRDPEVAADGPSCSILVI
jgi:putative zinc-dependent peptidase DUF5700